MTCLRVSSFFFAKVCSLGTWGHGNLDSDMALDELICRSDALIRELLERARRKEGREYDERDYVKLFVDFEILFALESKNLFQPSKLPTPDEIDYLRADYIEDWQRYYEDAGVEKKHVTSRKRSIVKTFNKLRKICESHRTEATRSMSRQMEED